MSEFIFEDLGPNFECSGTAQVFDVGGVDPTNLIRSDQDAFVRIRLRTEGAYTTMIGGKFRLRLHLERMGPGPELNLPAAPVEVGLVPGVSPQNYTRNITIAAGSVTPGAYKLVTTVTYESLAGNPGPIAGYSEGPILQFYNAA